MKEDRIKLPDDFDTDIRIGAHDEISLTKECWCVQDYNEDYDFEPTSHIDCSTCHGSGIEITSDGYSIVRLLDVIKLHEKLG